MGSRMVSFPINMLLVGTPKLMNYYWLSITTSPAAIRVPTMIEVFQRLHTSFRIKHCSPVTCSYSLTGFFSTAHSLMHLALVILDPLLVLEMEDTLLSQGLCTCCHSVWKVYTSNRPVACSLPSSGLC